MDVGHWPRNLGLGQYEVAFRDNESADEILPELTEIMKMQTGSRLTMTMLLAVVAATFIGIRVYGMHAGWWNTVLPLGGLGGVLHSAWESVTGLLKHVMGGRS